MQFNSLIFILFFVVVVVVYHLLSGKWKNLWLLAASYVFYGVWDYRFLLLLNLSIVVDYFAGLMIHKSADINRRKQFLTLSVLVNLGLLGVFKYFNFFSESFTQMASHFGFQVQGFYLELILPLGISFYTFQTLSYTIDVYREKVEPTCNFIDFSLYVSFFPQLVSGPIERAQHFLPQILKDRQITWPDVREGLYLVMLGFYKKLVIADSLAIYALDFQKDVRHLSGATLLTGSYLLILKVYCDFSGYTDIARGLAKFFGFDLIVNFRRPFFATSVSDFFSRWHISLTHWFKDYLYTPLKGASKSRVRTTLCLFATLTLAGLWHGAAGNFLVLGLSQFALFMIYYLLRPVVQRNRLWKALPLGLRSLVAILVFFHLCMFVWSSFHLRNVSNISSLITGIFSWQSGRVVSLGMPVYQFLALLVPLVIIEIQDEYSVLKTKISENIYVPVILMFLILLFGVVESYEFVYFQF